MYNNLWSFFVFIKVYGYSWRCEKRFVFISRFVPKKRKKKKNFSAKACNDHQTAYNKVTAIFLSCVKKKKKKEQKIIHSFALQYKINIEHLKIYSFPSENMFDHKTISKTIKALYSEKNRMVAELFLFRRIFAFRNILKMPIIAGHGYFRIAYSRG